MDKIEETKSIKSEVIEIRKIFNDWDSIVLSPEDEYDCLTHQIISELYRGIFEEEIVLFIKIEMINHFGINAEENRIREVSKKIWHYWNNRNQKED